MLLRKIYLFNLQKYFVRYKLPTVSSMVSVIYVISVCVCPIWQQGESSECQVL